MNYLGMDVPVTYISGSHVWPSSDRSDSPFDVYRCERCNWQMSYQMGGSFPIDQVPSVAKAMALMFQHLALCTGKTHEA